MYGKVEQQWGMLKNSGMPPGFKFVGTILVHDFEFAKDSSQSKN